MHKKLLLLIMTFCFFSMFILYKEFTKDHNELIKDHDELVKDHDELVIKHGEFLNKWVEKENYYKLQNKQSFYLGISVVVAFGLVMGLFFSLIKENRAQQGCSLQTWGCYRLLFYF